MDIDNHCMFRRAYYRDKSKLWKIKERKNTFQKEKNKIRDIYEEIELMFSLTRISFHALTLFVEGMLFSLVLFEFQFDLA